MKSFLLLLIVFVPHFLFAQSAAVPVDDDTYYEMLDRLEIKSGHFLTDIYTSTKPYLRQDIVKSVTNLDTIKAIRLTKVDRHNLQYLADDNSEWINSDSVLSKKPVLKTFYKTKADLYSTQSKDFMLKINPVLSFSYGKQDDAGETMFENTRGAEVRGWIDEKVGFYIYIGENQARYPTYVQQYTNLAGAVPGEGYYKNYNTTGVDFLTTSGYFNFKVAKFITVTFGQDKNVFGDGFRSLQLSDFSENYPFLKLSAQVWKLNYTVVYADFTSDFLRGADTLLQHKYGAFHHLSLNVTKFLNIGLFDGVIFDRNNGYEISYMNPVIFYDAVEKQLGSPDNAMIGGDFKANFLKHFSIYGQLAVDDFNFEEFKAHPGYWGDKYGTQLGIKYVDAFMIPNLDIQLENNRVTPYTYTHNDFANYANYNQPLADPLGANFNEVDVIARYEPIKNLWLTAKLIEALYGQDTVNAKDQVVSNWGGDINKLTTLNTIYSPYGNTIGQGIRTHLTMIDLTASYMIRHNLFIDGEIILRKADANTVLKNTPNPNYAYSSDIKFVSLGIRMNIAKKSLDY